MSGFNLIGDHPAGAKTLDSGRLNGAGRNDADISSVGVDKKLSVSAGGGAEGNNFEGG